MSKKKKKNNNKQKRNKVVSVKTHRMLGVLLLALIAAVAGDAAVVADGKLAGPRLRVAA